MMPKILVIDSDPQMGKALNNLLSQKGFQSAAVRNGVDAAKLLCHDIPDLTIIDQGVALTGIKTAQILRIKPQHQHMPILLGLKPGAPEHTRQVLKSAMDGGVSWVIARPYNPERIIEKIHEQLDKSAKTQKNTPYQRRIRPSHPPKSANPYRDPDLITCPTKID
jgi:DNA-binding response OmpR family regulator